VEAIAQLPLKRLCLVDGEGPLRTAKDKFLNVALAAIPRISEIIAAYPAEHRAGALKVAARRYRRAAWDFGCALKRIQTVRSMQSCEPCKYKSRNI
jgi:hypothetical protein